MSPSTLDGLLDAYTHVSTQNALAMRQLAMVAAAFRQRRIELLLLKGGDLVSRLYGARGVRPIADLDLLVREADLPAIEDTLTAMGYRPEIDGNPAYSIPGGLTLDLVTSFWYLDSEALEAVWRRAVTSRIGTQRVQVLSSDDLLIHLTAYTVVHRAALSARFATDLALLTHKEPLDWDFIVAEAEARGLKIPLYHGLAYAHGQACGRATHERCAIPDSALRRLAPASRSEHLMAFLLRKLVTEEFTYGTGFLLLFLTQPGLNKWRWLHRAFFPPAAFLRYRYGSRAARHPGWVRCGRAAGLLRSAPRLGCHLLRALLRPTGRGVA